MIREIENRRSIRKYKPDEIERKLIEESIYSASLAPSAKNRQPWKFIVYRYFETFAPEAVQFPFGFGLSYTSFALTQMRAEAQGDTVRPIAPQLLLIDPNIIIWF